MTERDEAEPPHQRPGIADERPEEDLDDDVPDVLLSHAERQGRHRGEDEERQRPDRPAARHERLAKMPPGRAKISTMKMTKAMT